MVIKPSFRMAQGRTSRREGVLLGVRGNAVAAFGPVGGDRAAISLSRGFGLNMLACEEAIDGPFEASSANGSVWIAVQPITDLAASKAMLRARNASWALS